MDEKRTSEPEQDPEVNPATFARQVIEAAARHQHLPDAPDEDFYRQHSACFVCVKMKGELRGCIGTLEPSEPDLGSEIIRNARSSAFADPRFPAVMDDELDDIEVSVDVLSEPETVISCEGQNSKEYGIIVSRDYRRGVLLPDLDGVDNVEQQLEIARQKAGISPDEDYQIQRFTVARYFEDAEPET